MEVLVNRVYSDKQGNSPNNSYLAKEIAIDSETGESIVVYQKLYGDFKTCCIKETMFLEKLSELDLSIAGNAICQNDRTVQVKRIYRHFKGKYYFVKEIAFEYETDEPFVVYQKLFGDYSTYVRKEKMFLEDLSEADLNREENTTNQKARFVLVAL